jgi:hypothetical protein
MQHLVAQLAQLPDRYIVRWQFSLVNVVAVIPIISPFGAIFYRFPTDAPTRNGVLHAGGGAIADPTTYGIMNWEWRKMNCELGFLHAQPGMQTALPGLCV